MWNFVIAGLLGGVTYLLFKEDKTDVDTQKSSPKKITRSKKLDTKKEASKELLSAIQKDGFEEAIISYSDYKDIQDAQFDKLRTSFIKNVKSLETYIQNKNPKDSKYRSSTLDALSKEGLEYGFLSGDYNDWKGVKDMKFQALLSKSKNDYNRLVEHLKKKFKIKNLSDDELDNAINNLEGQ